MGDAVGDAVSPSHRAAASGWLWRQRGAGQGAVEPRCPQQAVAPAPGRAPAPRVPPRPRCPGLFALCCLLLQDLRARVCGAGGGLSWFVRDGFSQSNRWRCGRPPCWAGASTRHVRARGSAPGLQQLPGPCRLDCLGVLQRPRSCAHARRAHVWPGGCSCCVPGAGCGEAAAASPASTGRGRALERCHVQGMRRVVPTRCLVPKTLQHALHRPAAATRSEESSPPKPLLNN